MSGEKLTRAMWLDYCQESYNEASSWPDDATVTIDQIVTDLRDVIAQGEC